LCEVRDLTGAESKKSTGAFFESEKVEKKTAGTEQQKIELVVTNVNR